MFEIEAGFAETKMLIKCNGDYSKKQDYKKGWQDGAEFGYNKAMEWHDLEKDPKDLPNENGEYVVKVREYGDILVNIGRYWKKEKMFTGHYLKELDVIKWKEIE